MYTIDQLTTALEAAHNAACAVLGLDAEQDSSPVAYLGPCGLEPWHAALWQLDGTLPPTPSHVA